MSSAIIFSFIYDYLECDNVYYIIKSKSKKSHGIDKEILEKVENANYSLLIFPDGASGDFGYQERLHKMNCDVLILDHHPYDVNRKTNAIIINNQCESVENTALSGTGCTYKFCFYCAEKLGIDLGCNYIDLVAISLISDMCDMTSLENRYLFNLGTDLNNVSNELIKEFVNDLKIKKKITIENIAYGISSRMNAIIRMSEGEEKESMFESLIGSEETVEYKYRGKVCKQSIQASIIRASNRLKQKQKKMINNAISDGLDLLSNSEDRIIIIDAKNISSEIRGLLCNKLVGEYSKPVMMLSGSDVLSGSCRGVNSISFKDLIVSSNLFNYAEGHTNAFGCSINRVNLEKFIKYINHKLIGVDLNNEIEIDHTYEGSIPIEDVIELGELDALWCNEIKRPKILIKNMKIDSSRIIKRGIDLSYKDDNGVLYKRDFCSKIFYEDLICINDNPDLDKIINVDMIVEVKTFESGISYINIVEFESNICCDN